MPVLEKVKVIFEMDELIESKLRKKYVKAPSKDREINYIVDLYTDRTRQYFYFCAKYHCRAKNRIADYFEHRFARLEYTAVGFNLAYMRYTDKWWEIDQRLSLNGAFRRVAEGGLFEP
jgi:hypothetical protein